MPRHEGLGRPVRAEIDTSAFRHNIAEVERLSPQSNVLVVIKADAYGHGALELAKAAGDKDLAVASSDEAKSLIDAGLKNRIWILEGPFNQACLALSAGHELVWVVHSEWQLELLRKSSMKGLSLWLKLDTGMHRLGFSPAELPAVYRRLQQTGQHRVMGLITHFSSSDLAVQSSVKDQLAVFDGLARSDIFKGLAQSTANSGAVLLFPESHRDWVRPGIMLYGGLPSPEMFDAPPANALKLKPVMSLKSAVMALCHVPAGESVGYGGVWRAEKDSLIATVAAGYADGYPRHAPSGTPVAINGSIVPLVGRVSMDMLTIDVSALEAVKVGDEVELWGNALSIEHIAKAAGTISYELLTGVTKRVPRIYL